MREKLFLDKAYKVYEALKRSEQRILAGEQHWKEDLQFARWDWRQGVGLYGIWNLYKLTNDQEVLSYIEGWIDRRIAEGQPLEKHINTVCPMLSVACVYQETKNPKYLSLIIEWANWILNEVTGLQRTNERGFSHYCGEKSPNHQQLWDDTLFVTVLFLAKAGVILNKQEYLEEAYRQFIIHSKYLLNKNTGLWYHVFTFEGRHNYSNALWGRGNCWITASIPEFLETSNFQGFEREVLSGTLESQVEGLKKFQDNSGLWHTLINDPNSYLETTGSAGFAFGILKAIRLGIIDDKYSEVAKKALNAVLDNIDDEGYLRQASDGTPLGDDLDFYRNVALNTRAYAQGLSIMLLTEAYINKL